MTPTALNEFGMDVLAAGAVVLWVVLLLRLPGAIRSVPQRRLLIAAAGLAGSVTVYLDPVTALLARTPLAGDCGIVMNVWGMLSSAFILDLVLAALSKRRPWLVYGSAAAVSAVLVSLNAAEGGQAGCVTSLDVPWYSPFWWLLCIAHIIAVIPSTALCARYARRATTRSLRIGLGLLAAGFASSTFFWGVVVLGYLLTRSDWVGAFFPLNIGVTAWLIVAGTGLPLLIQARRQWRYLQTLWRLRPLWRQLVDTVPHVRMPEPALRSVPSGSIDLRLYRRVIEIRDALLILRDYVSPHTVDAARAHVKTAAPASEQEPLTTACWLAVAQAAKEGGADPRPSALAAPAPRAAGEDAWTSEIKFQEALARVRQAPLVLDFVNHQSGGRRRASATIGAQEGPK